MFVTEYGRQLGSVRYFLVTAQSVRHLTLTELRRARNLARFQNQSLMTDSERERVHQAWKEVAA